MAYFDDVNGEPTAAGRFDAVGSAPALELAPGVECRPIRGESMLMSFVTLQPHAEAPVHAHVEEQLVIVLEGEMEFSIDGDVRWMRPGDVAIVPPWVRHGAKAGAAGCREVDIFTPPRAGMVRMLEELDRAASAE